MHWTDSGILLSNRKYGENSAIARIFSREHGVYGGIVRGASSKKNRGIFAAGNIVSATWNARLSDQLGNFTCELLEARAAFIMQDTAKLAALSSACTLMEAALPERHPYPKLYKEAENFLNILAHPHPTPLPDREREASAFALAGEGWLEEYVTLELTLLAETGFGLDLTHCAATGATEDLIYVSPKSGRAVSREAGEPYKEKLLPLPAFLINGSSTSVPSPRRGEGQGGGDLIPHARQLRKNLTEAERKLWYQLRAHRFELYGFRRQYPIEERYIADFACLEKMLIIEVDGGQHSEQQTYDEKRTAFLESQGYKVLRFWNNEVLENMEGVLTNILQTLESTPPPPLPRKREREQQRPLPPKRGRELPPFSQEKAREILAGMQLTGYFLDHWLLEPHHRKLPAARKRLTETLKDTHG